MVPESVKNKRVVVLDLSGMVAGSKYRGEFEERIRNVINEVRSNQGILLLLMSCIRSLARAVQREHWMLPTF